MVSNTTKIGTLAQPWLSANLHCWPSGTPNAVPVSPSFPPFSPFPYHCSCDSKHSTLFHVSLSGRPSSLFTSCQNVVHCPRPKVLRDVTGRWFRRPLGTSWPIGTRIRFASLGHWSASPAILGPISLGSLLSYLWFDFFYLFFSWVSPRSVSKIMFAWIMNTFFSSSDMIHFWKMCVFCLHESAVLTRRRTHHWGEQRAFSDARNKIFRKQTKETTTSFLKLSMA